MIKFEKVSFPEFAVSCIDAGYTQFTDAQLKDFYNNIKLPTRGTKASAGYDFYTPLPVKVDATTHTCTVPLGIRVVMPEDVFLMVVPRSGVGFKTGTSLANTVGIIDSDYHEAKNEGHIKAKLVYGFSAYDANPGDRIFQAIFIKYLTTDDDNATAQRTGGFGSTNK